MILVGTILMVFGLEFFLIWFSQHCHPVTVMTTWTIHMALAIAVVMILVSTSNTWSMFVPFLLFLACYGGLDEIRDDDVGPRVREILDECFCRIRNRHKVAPSGVMVIQKNNG